MVSFHKLPDEAFDGVPSPGAVSEAAASGIFPRRWERAVNRFIDGPPPSPFTSGWEPRLRASQRIRWANGVSKVEEGAIPRRGVAPANGVAYTWRDDALNLDARAREIARRERHASPTHPSARSDGRCRGWSRTHRRPCRQWGAVNLDGEHANFCAWHGARPRMRAGVMGDMLVLRTPRAVVDRASKAAKHGAYSEIVEMQLRAALAENDNSELRKQAEADLEVMEGVNADDPAEALKVSIKLVAAKMQRVQRMFFAGAISNEDHTVGLTILTDQLRKLLLAKHTITGTASDEQDAALSAALKELGLDAPMSSEELESADAIGVLADVEDACDVSEP